MVAAAVRDENTFCAGTTVFKETALTSLRMPGGPVVSKLQADLEYLAHTPIEPISFRQQAEFNAEMRQGLWSLRRLLPAGRGATSYLQPFNWDEPSRIGTVFMVRVAQVRGGMNIRLCEHDSAFVFKTAEGADTYMRVARSLEQPIYASKPCYMRDAHFRNYYPTRRNGDALLYFELTTQRRYWGLGSQHLAKECSLSVTASSQRTERCEVHFTDFTKLNPIHMYAGGEDGMQRIVRDPGDRDCRFIRAHLCRLLAWAETIE